jgi:undecaprenyl-diphosphatase
VDVVLLVKAAIMGVVEGLTEFLPVSSTGHLILAGSLLGFHDEKAKVFDIAIQTGAILAVIIVYWQKIRETLVALPTQESARRFALNVFVGFLPAAVIGLLAYKTIKAHRFAAPGAGPVSRRHDPRRRAQGGLRPVLRHDPGHQP